MIDPLQPNKALYGLDFTFDTFAGMPYGFLGRSGLRVSRVGLGTWKFGFPETGDGARVDRKAAFQIFDRAIELGVTFWDTANRYNNASGNSERLIGEWLAANPDQRRNVVLATKLFGSMDGRTPNHCRLGRTNILESTYASLKRMRVDVIDVLYFHSFDPLSPARESLEAIADLRRRDLVRYLAVSNFSVENLALYDALADAGLPEAIAVQNSFNLLDGEAKPGTLDYCARTGKSLVAWSPLGEGMLTDRYVDLSRVGKGDRLFDQGQLAAKLPPEKHAKLAALAGRARAWGMETSRLALAYTLALPGMGPIIPGTSTVKQLESNAAVAQVLLTAEQMQEVAKIISGR